jgi:hypothetical protein
MIQIGHGGAVVCRDNTRSRTRRADGGGRQVLERKKGNRGKPKSMEVESKKRKKKHLNRTYNTLNLMEKKKEKQEPTVTRRRPIRTHIGRRQSQYDEQRRK